MEERDLDQVRLQAEVTVGERKGVKKSFSFLFSFLRGEIQKGIT